jgi:hypothetical protein
LAGAIHEVSVCSSLAGAKTNPPFGGITIHEVSVFSSLGDTGETLLRECGPGLHEVLSVNELGDTGESFVSSGGGAIHDVSTSAPGGTGKRSCISLGGGAIQFSTSAAGGRGSLGLFVLARALGVCWRILGSPGRSKLPSLNDFKNDSMILSLETDTIRIVNACVHVARAYMSGRKNIKREICKKDMMSGRWYIRNAHSRATTDCD